MYKKSLKLSLFLVCLALIFCIGLIIELYIQNRDLKNPSSLIYAGLLAPQDISSRIEQSINNFDQNQIENWYKDRIFDKEYQIACFDSYVAISLAEKCHMDQTNYKMLNERNYVFLISMNKWDNLIKKDEDMKEFKKIFLNKYEKEVSMGLTIQR